MVAVTGMMITRATTMKKMSMAEKLREVWFCHEWQNCTKE